MLTANQRRVAGVLIEKSKTTPDAYPMTLNSIRNGCNQKSNRSPVMNLGEDRVEQTLYELRGFGAVVEMHSGGRVPKFRHEMYEWLSVEKAGLAVMAELLLRGAQTLGDLRARSSRMEASLQGLPDLQPVVESLLAADLMVELTPRGRGQMVTHNLYRPEELEKIRSEIAGGQVVPAASKPKKAAPPATADPGLADPGLAVRLAALEQRVAELESIARRS